MTGPTMEKLAALATRESYNSLKKCDAALHDRQRGWVIANVQAAVRTFYRSNKVRGQKEMLDSLGFVSNGQTLSVLDLLVILEETTHPKAWLKTRSIEALLFFSVAARRFKEGGTSAYRTQPSILQFFGPSLGKDFYAEGECDPAESANVGGEQVNILAQLVRLKAEPLEPYADAARLATLEQATRQCARVHGKIITEQARWRDLDTRDATTLESLDLDKWAVLLVFYGDGQHWRLLLVLRYGWEGQLAHIVYDPLYRITQPGAPGTIIDEEQAERALRILRGMSNMGYSVFSSWPLLIEGSPANSQQDWWSCGWRAFTYFETIVEHFGRTGNATPALDNEADEHVLALFDTTREASDEEREEQLEQCKRLRVDFRILVTALLALAYHTLDEEITKDKASRVPLNRF